MTAEYELQNHVCPHCKSVYRAALLRCALDGHELEPFESDPLIGKQFADRYVIEDCIGVGGMGRVYRARHQNVSRRFAVKVLFGELASDRTMRARFAREAEAASRLDHPNVVAVVDFGQTEEGLLYLVMDFVEGPTLRDLITEKAPIPPALAIDLSIRLARGLGHAHKLGLVHRDFKPGNVIIAERDEELVPRIVDFGIAFIDDPSGAGSRLTQSGAFIGTPACMAPEQAAARAVDHRADLYSLGVTMYEMLTGVPPYDGPGMEVIHQHCLSPFPPMADRAPSVYVPHDLEALIRDMMAKSPDERPSSARAVIERLKAINVDETQLAMAPATPTGATRRLTPFTPQAGTPVVAPAMMPTAMDSAPHARPYTPSPFPPGPITHPGPVTAQDSANGRRWILYFAAAGLVLGLTVTAILSWGGGGSKASSSALASATADAAVEAAPVASADATQLATPDAAVAAIELDAAADVEPDASAQAVARNDDGDQADDAGDAKVDEPGDANAGEPRETDENKGDATPSPTRRRETSDRRKVERTRPRQSPRPQNTEVTRDQFLGRYREVGAQLVKLGKVAPAAAAPLRGRYAQISPQASLRSPEVRASSYQALGKIRSAANAALKKAK